MVILSILLSFTGGGGGVTYIPKRAIGNGKRQCFFSSSIVILSATVKFTVNIHQVHRKGQVPVTMDPTQIWRFEIT